MAENKDKIVIVGAGIAGLSLAIQLAERQIACVVLEARSSFYGVTSGVRISTQGVKILEKMNIRNVGEPTERTIMHYGSIKADFSLNNPKGASPAIIVTRLSIHEKLMERVNQLGIKIINDFNMVNAVESADGVEITSESGQIIKGKFLVGADGVGSIVRKILNPNQNSGKTYAGYLGVGIITPRETKIEMSLYLHPRNHVGIASIGKVSTADVNNNIFLWTHIYVAEQQAKSMDDEKVIEMIEANSKNWSAELRSLFEKARSNPKTIIAHGAVYNGKVPANWYSEKMILIGDGAHPYGPGGQGISMALKDAEALCDLFVSGISNEKKASFQKTRAAEAKALGEIAEERNKPENQLASRWSIFFKGLSMKSYHFFNRGVLKSF